MIIGIDGNEANVKSQVGVSVYTLELLKQFKNHATAGTQFVIYLRNTPGDWMPEESSYFRYVIVQGKIMWSQVFLPIHLFMHSQIDVFFAPAHYAPRFLKVPLVLTIHDLSFFRFPQEFLQKDLYKLKNWTAYSIKKAQKIIAVSKTTKKDIISWYGLDDDSINVVYNGFRKRSSIRPSDNALMKYHLNKEEYILYVGTLQPRKNIQTLIAAFETYKKKNASFKLVIAGKKGWLFDKIFQEVQTRGLNDSVLFTGYTSDEELVSLYSNAFCFVMPSLYEGFGIPLLEAMSYQCPVISSHASSLPEIGADACLYFDPTSSEDLTAKLFQLQSEAELRTALTTAGRNRIKQFSWATAADQTLTLIKQAASSV